MTWDKMHAVEGHATKSHLITPSWPQQYTIHLIAHYYPPENINSICRAIRKRLPGEWIFFSRFIKVTHRQTDRQTDRDTDRQTDRQTYGQTDIQTYKYTDRWTDIRTDRLYGQTDRQTNRQTVWTKHGRGCAIKRPQSDVSFQWKKYSAFRFIN
jgi:hypothetical protein